MAGPLSGSHTADLVVVGGGYAGLWTALLAKRREPSARVVLIDAVSVGWAASGRNGGFCEASLTHGYENGLSRWPGEIDTLERLGTANLDSIESDLAAWGADVEFERVGSLAVATEPYQVDALLSEPARPGHVLLDQAQIQAAVASPTYLAAEWDTHGCALVHPGKLAFELARVAEELGVEIFEGTRATSVTSASSSGSGATVATTTTRGGVAGELHAGRVALATNVFPSLLKRNTPMTVPVYDYVLMTEPLSSEQLASIGWGDRQGISDMANQFHYYRLTADNRILWGGYDAVYHFGGRVNSAYENRPATFTSLANHFFATFPQLEGLRFTHKWAGAIDTSTRFCAFFGTAHAGRVAYALGFTGLGVGATRFAGEVMLDLLDGVPTERTELQMVRERPLPFPPEPAAFVGIRATTWSLDQADHRSGERNLLLRTMDRFGLGFDS